MAKEIYLTNNLSNKREQFVPIDENNIRMYVCGPTVYNDPHIGNARPLVIFDILYKVLKNKFKLVNYVRNITDVDDKIINFAKENNVSIKELTDKIIKSFAEDCSFLKCEEPNHQPKATEHIDLMIEMTKTLISKGFAQNLLRSKFLSSQSLNQYVQSLLVDDWVLHILKNYNPQQSF